MLGLSLIFISGRQIALPVRCQCYVLQPVRDLLSPTLFPEFHFSSSTYNSIRDTKILVPILFDMDFN